MLELDYLSMWVALPASSIPTLLQFIVPLLQFCREQARIRHHQIAAQNKSSPNGGSIIKTSTKHQHRQKFIADESLLVEFQPQIFSNGGSAHHGF
jgi:hypothetical protein